MSCSNKDILQYESYNNDREPGQRTSFCHAPLQNLLFVQSGDMMVCHYNRGFILGRYPEMNPSDAWNGAKLNQLRRYLSQYDPPESCDFCKNEVLSRNILSSGCKKYDYLAGNAGDFPSSIEFQISNICNLECMMCSGEYSSLIRKNRENGAAYIQPYDKNFICDIEPFLKCAKHLSFTGGEPFLNDLYYEIWSLLPVINPEARITISTNGTTLNEKVKKLLKDCHAELTISIDSIEKESYERIRKNASFVRTMQNMDYFLEFSKKHNRLLSVKCVIMKDNIRQFPELFRYFHERAVQVFPKPVWVPFDLSLRYSAVAEMQENIDFLSSFDFRGGSPLLDFNVLRYHETISTLKAWKKEREMNTTDILYDLGFEEIESRLMKSLLAAIGNDNLIDLATKTKLMDHAEKTLHALFLHQPDLSVRKELGIKMLLLPEYLIINEIYRMDMEKFLRRFQTLTI